jgi:hypothetical protein
LLAAPSAEYQYLSCEDSSPKLLTPFYPQTQQPQLENLWQKNPVILSKKICLPGVAEGEVG